MAKLIPVFRGICENGKLEITEKEKFNLWLEELKGECEIIVRPRRRLRSLKENSYYWAVIVRMIAEEMGVFDDRVHEFLKGMFLKEGIEVKGKRYEVVRSTTSLSTIAFEEYAEKCRLWAGTELNLNIPLPNEIDLEKDLEEKLVDT